MPEFDIDSFKKTWQEQDVKPKYDSTEILQMLNKNSRNYVKYILWISIAEFLLILGVSVYYFYKGEEGNSFVHILEKMNINVTPEIFSTLDNFYYAMKFLSIGITLFFVIRFYLNYKRINVEANLKKFIIQIMEFKRTVNLFILVNILFLVFTTLVLILFMFSTLSSQNIEVNSATLTGLIVGIVVALAFSVGLIWLYYRLIYGIIMKRLSKNLAQLKEIEQEN